MKTFLLSLVLVAQALTTGLEITVLDAAQEPVEGLQLTLTTYIYNQEGEAMIRESVSCKTDPEGSCSLILSDPNKDGMQYATLQVGEYGTRDLTWPGGMMKLVIPLDQLGFGREAAPYDFQAEDGGVLVRTKDFPLYAVLMALLLITIFWLIYRYAKKQEGV